MSDDQQMTNSIEAHTVPSTSAKDLQVKIGKNRRATANANKKLKKQSIQRRDVNSIEAIGPTKSVADTTSNQSNQSNQERSAGSVVITIRLLKMESTRSFDVSSVGGNDDIQTDIYSNNNIPMGGRSQQTPFSSELKTIEASQNNVNGHEKNSKQNQNNSCKVDNNNVSLNQSETIPATNIWMTENKGTTTVNNFLNCDNGNNSNSELNERNSIKKQHVNRALRSEASICDKVQQNCTSQPEQLSNAGNCLAHTLNTINLTDTSASVFSPSQTTTTDNNKMKSVQDNANAFISSNLIGSVSPYPHHIPIANIIRSDCLSGVVGDDRKFYPFTVYPLDHYYYYVENRFVCCVHH